MLFVGLLLIAHASATRPPPGYSTTFNVKRQALPGALPQHPPVLPSRGAVATGKWRNMFVEMGIDEASVVRRVDAIFDQLFAGNADERLLYEASDGSGAYILSVDSNDVRSEGMSYGMMIAAQRDNMTMFEALWRWAKTHMRHNAIDDARHGYFAWHCSPTGKQLDANPASDGETWFAAALYTAAARWNRPDYATEAAALLQDATNKTGRVQSVTAMFNSATGVASAPAQVVFVPYAHSATYTDPSYHLPAFYALWARHAPANTTAQRPRSYAALNTTCQHAKSITGALSVSSVGECEVRCDNEPRCVAIDTDGSTCYLKSHCEGAAGSCPNKMCGYRQATGPPTPPSPPTPPRPPGPTPPSPSPSVHFWTAFVHSSRNYFELTFDPYTSLSPDYSSFDGQPTGGQHMHFAFDAWRVSQNVAMDYAWFATDERPVGFCTRLHSFFHKANASAPYGNQFDVSTGRQLSADHSPGLVAMNAVCALASNQSIAWEFVAELWATPTPTGKYRYYDGMLYMLGWLQLAGQFRYYEANATLRS